MDWNNFMYNYSTNKNSVLIEIIRGMRRRAIDNYFNRERMYLDDGKASFPWNFKQMREIYNFNDEGMSYQNAGIVNMYDAMENIVKEAAVNGINVRKLINKKIQITYINDINVNLEYVGNMNNIRLKG